jgi:glucose/arabinose dehydrogenase
LHRLPFYATVAVVVALSFAWLLFRSRPILGGGGVQPVLFASGFNQPRGLAVGSDGTVYVAEAGWAGAGQTPLPGRVSRVSGREQIAVVADGLPAAAASQPLFAQSGPAGLAPATGGLDVLFGPAAGQPLGGIAQLELGGGASGSTGAGGVGAPAPLALAGGPAGGPATVWGARPSGDGSLYAALPLVNLLVRLDPQDGQAIPVTGFIGPGGSNPMPAGVATAPDGSVYVAHFGPEPYRPGTGRIVRVLPDGRWESRYEGLTFPVALAFNPDGVLFVLELAAGYDARSGQFQPQSGRLMAVGPDENRRRVVVRDVDFPTALAFSAAGDAYFTESGAFRGPGAGRILLVPGQTLRPPA